MTPGAVSAPNIRRASVEDAALLASLAATTFRDTFASDNTPENMSQYMEGAFGESVQRDELADPRVTVLIAERDGGAVGYVMLRDGVAPIGVDAANPIEIARLYATRQNIGGGVGAALMQRAIDVAAEQGKDVIWLGVWERNTRAIAFYERFGFRNAGTQPFQLGDDLQTDRVMKRMVREEG